MRIDPVGVTEEGECRNCLSPPQDHIVPKGLGEFCTKCSRWCTWLVPRLVLSHCTVIHEKGHPHSERYWHRECGGEIWNFHGARVCSKCWMQEDL